MTRGQVGAASAGHAGWLADGGVILGVPSGARTEAWVRVWIAAAALAFCFILPPILSSFDVLYICFALTLVLAPVVVGLMSFAFSHDVRYVLDPQGITCVRQSGATTRVDWGEIVRVRERRIIGGLEVTTGGGSTLRVVRAVDGYQVLMEEILRRAQPIYHAGGEAAEKTGEFVFARSSLPLVVSGIIGPAAPLVSIGLFGGVLFLFHLIVLTCVTIWLGSWLSVRVTAHTVTIRHLLWARRIPVSDIEHVGLRGRSRTDPAGVLLTLSNGRSIELTRCKGGALALYSALVHEAEKIESFRQRVEE